MKHHGPSLDLHGIKHADVDSLVENFVLLNQDHMPLEIIYGNSPTMRKLVTDCLDRLEAVYNSGYKNQYGRLLVVGWQK